LAPNFTRMDEESAASSATYRLSDAHVTQAKDLAVKADDVDSNWVDFAESVAEEHGFVRAAYAPLSEGIREAITEVLSKRPKYCDDGGAKKLQAFVKTTLSRVRAYFLRACDRVERLKKIQELVDAGKTQNEAILYLAEVDTKVKEMNKIVKHYAPAAGADSASAAGADSASAAGADSASAAGAASLPPSATGGAGTSSSVSGAKRSARQLLKSDADDDILPEAPDRRLTAPGGSLYKPSPPSAANIIKLKEFLRKSFRGASAKDAAATRKFLNSLKDDALHRLMLALVAESEAEAHEIMGNKPLKQFEEEEEAEE